MKLWFGSAGSLLVSVNVVPSSVNKSLLSDSPDPLTDVICVYVGLEVEVGRYHVNSGMPLGDIAPSITLN